MVCSEIRNGKEIILYHGSKSGIAGAISPVSRSHCDFGKGFYMGTDRSQSLTLICNYPDARIYTLRVDLSHLMVLDMETGIDWALLIAYHRGKMEAYKGSEIYKRYAGLCNGCDMVIGPIANDRMFVVLDRFFNGEITDFALIQSLSALKLGKQYVALTDKACGKIQIVDENMFSEYDREELKRIGEKNRSSGIAMANDICRKYRRKGRFFDEILEGGDLDAKSYS